MGGSREQVDVGCRSAVMYNDSADEDVEAPRLSVSIGVAEYPRDGLSIEHILSAADQALYNEKHRLAGRPVVAEST